MSRAFVLRNQTAVEDYREAQEALAAWRAQILRESNEMGLDPLVFLEFSGGREIFCGFEIPSDKSRIPAGWRKVASRKRLEPMRGAAGREAQDWVDARQSPASGIGVLATRHSLVPASRAGGGDGKIWVSLVQVFDPDDGALYALHRHDGLRGDMGDWEEVLMSEFYAAMEGASIRVPV